MPVLVNSFIAFSHHDFRYCLSLASVHLDNCFSLAVRTSPNFLLDLNTFLVFGVSNDLNVGFVDNFSVSSGIRICNGYWDLSSYRKFVDGRSWDRYGSGNWHSLELRILNVIDIVLLVVFLYNRLSDDLPSWNRDLFYSGDVLSLDWFYNWLQNDFFVISSVYLHFYLLSLVNRLVNSLVVDFIAGLYNDFLSVVLSVDRILGKRFEIEKLIFSGDKLNVFLVVDDLFLVDRLEVDGLIGVLVFSVDDLFGVLNWFGDVGQIFHSVVSLHYSDCIFKGSDGRLADSLLDDGVSWRSYLNISQNCFITHLGILSHLFSINGSLSLTLLDDRCLDDSLFDDWLRHNFSGDNRLSQHFLLHQGSADHFLCLSNKRASVVDFVSI